MKRNINFSKTKIIATIGPASRDVSRMNQLIEAGINIVRLNCSHAGPDELAGLIRDIQKACRMKDEPLSILADLGGPKIRLGKLEREIPIATGDTIVLTVEPGYTGSDKIPAGYPELAGDLYPGNHILIDDGLVQLEVVSAEDQDIRCKVLNDGVLKSKKGINLPGVDVSLSSLTAKDREDIDFLVTQPIDYIALSFVRHREDIRELRELLRSRGRTIPIIAKIEKPEAIKDLEGIIDETDMVMVARGDLGVEMPAEEVPLLQKRIISLCNTYNKPVITATQMLDSMIHNPRPTRAEASDVANAVFDGTDAVMLSGETSVGKYPVETVTIMNHIVRAAEEHRSPEQLMLLRSGRGKMSIEDSICYAACTMAEENNAAAIICLTRSGRTAKKLSRYRSSVPVLAFAERMETIRYLNIFWGVQAELIDSVGDTDYTLHKAASLAINLGYIKKGDTVVYTTGIPLVESKFTNMLKIDTV